MASRKRRGGNVWRNESVMAAAMQRHRRHHHRRKRGISISVMAASRRQHQLAINIIMSWRNIENGGVAAS